MNSIFHKTLIATALSAILGTTAMATENYQDTIDGGTNAEEQQNQHQQNRSDRTSDHKNMAEGKTPCDNDQNLTYGSDRDDSENRNKSKHQDNVLGEMDGEGKQNSSNSAKHSSLKDNAENRDNSQHQDDVLTERSATDNESAYDRDMNQQVEQDDSRYSSTADETSSKTTGLYSMSADELIGMEVVDTNGDEIGDITGVVLSQDRENAHAVINLGGIMGIGGRDVLASFDKLTMQDEKLRLHANQNEIESMTDYGSENHVDLEGDAKVSSELRGQ